jgi:transcription elongation factor Elf1
MFQCLKCSKVLSSKRRLEEHLIKNLPCNLECRVCEKKLLSKYKYYAHMKTHGNEEISKSQKKSIIF